MELPITITQCKLLLLTPELCTQVANATIKWHIPHETAQVMIKEINKCKEEQEHTQLAHMLATFAKAVAQHTGYRRLTFSRRC
jgi:hypothetical protein